jgi:hypothetical protein
MAMDDFIRIDKDQFVLDGKAVILRGLGVGSWLNLEHFMMGVPGWDYDIRRCLDQKCGNFMERFTESFFTMEDARYLRSLGINFIRVPINYHLFWDDQTDTPREYGFLQLKRLADICGKSGLYFMPDLHTTPGGQNPDCIAKALPAQHNSGSLLRCEKLPLPFGRRLPAV